VFGIAYLPSYYWLDDDDFLRRHRFNPRLLWKINDDLATVLSYNYYDNDYFGHDEWSGESHIFDFDVYYDVLDEKLRLIGGAGYEDNGANDPDYEYEQWEVRLGADIQGPWGLRFGVRGKYEDRTYDSADSFFGRDRDDNRYTGAFSISRNLYYDWLALVLEFEYMKNNSDIEQFEYERTKTTFSLTADL
jgi:hypothetical protein